jgi:hypothetical protein
MGLLSFLGAAACAPDDNDSMLDRLTSKDFADLPAGTLAVEHEGTQLPMEVLQLRELPHISPRAEPFSVILGGPASPLLGQGMHALVHPVHGRLEVFMVPIGRDPQRTRYEIIFN